MTVLDETASRERPAVMPKRSWVTLVVIEVLAIVQSVFILVAQLPNNGLMEMLGHRDGAGMTSDFETALSSLMRVTGTWFLAFALLALAVTLVPYRRGERWAWTVLWIFPALHLVNFLADMAQFGDRFPDYSTLGPVYLYYVVPSAVGLLLGISTIRRRARE